MEIKPQNNKDEQNSKSVSSYIKNKQIFIGLVFIALASVIPLIFMKSGSKEQSELLNSAVEDNRTVTQKTESEEDIDDFIRLILYDHEIGRTNIEESVNISTSGKRHAFFNVSCGANIYPNLISSMNAFFKNKGYSTNITDNSITASKDNYQYTINILSYKEEQKQEYNYTQNKTKEKQTYEPEPPAPSETTINIGILLDDGGHSLELAKDFIKIRYPVAIAVLPHLKYTKSVAKISKNAGKTVFLHFPMAPKSYPNTDPGKGGILPTMPNIIIDGIVKENFEDLGIKVDGFNNHMGSAITEDQVKMEQILKASKSYTDAFIDSRTTAQTVAYKVCTEIEGYKCGENRVFLDNDNNINMIIGKIYEAAEKAKKNGGYIIAIGHVKANTIAALNKALPVLEERNYRVVPLTSLLQ